MAIKHFEFNNQKLYIQGTPIDRLAQRVGSTPFYFYDRHLIGKRIAEIKDKLSKNFCLHYAVKANPMPALICFLSRLVDGFDVASAGELQLALDSGMAAENISFAGPGKTDAELRQAVAAGILVNVESLNEMYRISQIGLDANVQPRVALRLNPDFEMKQSGMKMGGGAKPFGIDSELLPSVVEVALKLGINIEGVHIFSGSQSLQASSIIHAQQQSVALLCKMKRYFTSDLKTINLGGGFGIPYFENDMEIDLDELSAGLNECGEKIKNEFQNSKIVLELGRFLVGEAGVYIAKVIDKKKSRGKTFLVLDGGMNHHLAASGNLGQVIKRNFPVVIANKAFLKEKEIVSIVGPLCTPLDTLGSDVEVSVCEIGDYVAIFQSGAYGLTASPQDFLGHPIIKEVLI
ncbi:MAG: pyridoxal-dependent decarboxylase, exosortase A system-associated [Bdellovibrionaceae bacterium]|nr:pyridoxal-dependent decarboxylase, exosortase A system-associated [Pseudobdellovibrionaceae bacterium]